ncbi:MAG: hypothetical protein HGA65_07005 [Oscillochloris sp.]|nr:hypothetical protein [Oscillochloris sp.]
MELHDGEQSEGAVLAADDQGPVVGRPCDRADRGMEIGPSAMVAASLAPSGEKCRLITCLSRSACQREISWMLAGGGTARPF